MTPRPASNAGVFYPETEIAVRSAIDHYGTRRRECFEDPVAVIAPHAGWRYCGPVMATAFGGLTRRNVDRVIHIGPSHHHTITGIVASGASHFETPIETTEVTEVSEMIAEADPAIHDVEHALEVQLPFLQSTLGTFDYIPLITGCTTPGQIASLFDALAAASPGTVTVVSSDLSHYLPASAARSKDRETLQAIEALEPHLTLDQACGADALNGLLTYAKDQGWRAVVLDRRDSADRDIKLNDSVVGYGAVAFFRGYDGSTSG